MNRGVSIGVPVFFIGVGLVLWLAVAEGTNLYGIDINMVGLIIAVLAGITLVVSVIMAMVGTKSETVRHSTNPRHDNEVMTRRDRL